MNKAMEFYNEVKEQLSEETAVCANITKREFSENGWKYTFFFYKGALSKIEGRNHRELIECWVR